MRLKLPPYGIFTYQMCMLPRRAICYNSNIMFHFCPDKKIEFEFPFVKTLILNLCDEEFVHLNISPEQFPKLKSIVSNSPIPPTILTRFQPSLAVAVANRWKTRELMLNKQVWFIADEISLSPENSTSVPLQWEYIR